MKHYELTYIISPEITLEEAEIFSKEISSFVEKAEGAILKSESPAAKTLSYPIKKMGSGYFTVLEFQSDPEKIKEIEEKLQKDGKVLRHMINIKKAEKIQKERRIKKEPEFTIEKPQESKVQPAETEPARHNAETPGGEKKVELEDIDKKLDEILGE